MCLEPAGLYVHIPFCRSKCLYCAFVSHVCGEIEQRDYVAALCGEISATGGDFSAPVDTVFFGGGTPTVLPVADLSRILQTLRSAFTLAKDPEISIEANPGTVDQESLNLLRMAGFNRLSIGAQSLDNRVLEGIGRIHRAEELQTSIAQARKAGFDNISVDLMYGLPLQSVQSWRETLSRVVSLGPDHISAYGLKLEEDTPLALAVASGQRKLPSEEEEEKMYDLLNDFLPFHGFARYEISNFSTPGHECRHNQKYWHFRSYRGLGLAAHSFDGRTRFSNTEDLMCYLAQLEAGKSPVTGLETLEPPMAMAEFSFLALRTVIGLSERDFGLRFGLDFAKHYASQLTRLMQTGLLEKKEGFWRLTQKGMKLSNQAFQEFLP